ncbi:MAG: ribokinase [Planctomycetota bacterium]
MSQTPKVCVVGSSNYDVTTFVPSLPAPGESLRGSRLVTGCGGKGSNQAVMSALLGASVSFVSRVGDDFFGDEVIRRMQSFGIDTMGIRKTAGVPTGVATIAVDDAGENAIIVVTGANDHLSASDVEASRSVIESADVLVCQLEVPLDSTLAALRIARSAGVTTVLNPAPALPSLPDEALELSDYFCPNETEAEQLSGEAVKSAKDAETATATFRRRGAGNVLVTLGAGGAVLTTESETRHLPADTVAARDSSGAGDACMGSFAFFLAAGHDAFESAARAVRVATQSVLRDGTQSSYPNAQELPAGLLDSPS